MNNARLIELFARIDVSWEDLATYFGFSPADRRRLQTGHEPRSIWEWLIQRDRQNELVDALQAIGRTDLIDLASDIVKDLGTSRGPNPGIPGATNVQEFQIVVAADETLSDEYALFEELVNIINVQARRISADYRFAVVNWEDAGIGTSSSARNSSRMYGPGQPRIVVFLVDNVLSSTTENRLKFAVESGGNDVSVIVFVRANEPFQAHDAEKLNLVKEWSRNDVQWFDAGDCSDKAVLATLVAHLVGIVMTVAGQCAALPDSYSEER